MVCLGELGSLDHKVLFDDSSDAVYANGYLLFVREGTLFAQQFSMRDLVLKGVPIPIAENVVTYHTVGAHGVFSLPERISCLSGWAGRSGMAAHMVWPRRQAIGAARRVGPVSRAGNFPGRTRSGRDQGPGRSPDWRRLGI